MSPLASPQLVSGGIAVSMALCFFIWAWNQACCFWGLLTSSGLRMWVFFFFFLLFPSRFFWGGVGVNALLLVTSTNLRLSSVFPYSVTVCVIVLHESMLPVSALPLVHLLNSQWHTCSPLSTYPVVSLVFTSWVTAFTCSDSLGFKQKKCCLGNNCILMWYFFSPVVSVFQKQWDDLFEYYFATQSLSHYVPEGSKVYD